MGPYLNPKIVGATIVGFALVAGAYVTSDFLAPGVVEQPASVEGSTRAAMRDPIPVADTDNNGLEDWRDAFLTNEIDLSSNFDENYVLPTTLTGKTGIAALEGMINSKIYAPAGKTNDEIIANISNSLVGEVSYSFYDTKDLDIMDEWEDEDIVNYANTMAATIIRYNDPDLGTIFATLEEYIRTQDKNSLNDLKEFREIYKNYRDDSLNTPVPKELAKPHLDLINTYNAVYEDLDAFVVVDEDPIKSLLFFKRFLEDEEAIFLALQNMFTALDEYGQLFTEDDPALLFLLFNPDYQSNL